MPRQPAVKRKSQDEKPGPSYDDGYKEGFEKGTAAANQPILETDLRLWITVLASLFVDMVILTFSDVIPEWGKSIFLIGLLFAAGVAGWQLWIKYKALREKGQD